MIFDRRSNVVSRSSIRRLLGINFRGMRRLEFQSARARFLIAILRVSIAIFRREPCHVAKTDRFGGGIRYWVTNTKARQQVADGVDEKKTSPLSKAILQRSGAKAAFTSMDMRGENRALTVP